MDRHQDLECARNQPVQELQTVVQVATGREVQVRSSGRMAEHRLPQYYLFHLYADERLQPVRLLLFSKYRSRPSHARLCGSDFRIPGLQGDLLLPIVPQTVAEPQEGHRAAPAGERVPQTEQQQHLPLRDEEDRPAQPVLPQGQQREHPALPKHLPL